MRDPPPRVYLAKWSGIWWEEQQPGSDGIYPGIPYVPEDISLRERGIDMSDDNQAEFYAIGDPEVLVHQDRDECVEAYLDDIEPGDFPETVTVVSYGRMAASLSDVWAEGMAEDVIERLDEDYGGEDHEQTHAAMDAIHFAAREFRDAVMAVYVPWTCEPCGEEEVVEVKAWVKYHCPEWLVDSEREEAT